MCSTDQECDSKDLEGLTSASKRRPSLNQRQQGCRVHILSASTRQFDSAQGLTMAALSARHKNSRCTPPWSLADRVKCPRIPTS